MSWLISALITGIAAAIATTFDDNIYLTLFFSRVNRHFRPQHVVVGEYLGFTLLVVVSLVGFLGGLMISSTWIGLLGFLPIIIGITNLLNREEEETIQTVSTQFKANSGSFRRQKSLWKTLRDPQTYRVSAVTIANGGNNLGIYIPLFASSTLPRLGVIIIVCYLAIGLWCLLSYHLTRQPMLAVVIARYARKVFPFILIWLGFSIIMDNQSYQLLSNLFTRT
jgi:cadmium resistance protein CadD (predicted permease)